MEVIYLPHFSFPCNKLCHWSNAYLKTNAFYGTRPASHHSSPIHFLFKKKKKGKPRTPIKMNFCLNVYGYARTPEFPKLPFGTARTALCSLGEREQSSGAVPAPGGVRLRASPRSPRPADAAQMEGGQGVCWPKLGDLLKDL